VERTRTDFLVFFRNSRVIRTDNVFTASTRTTELYTYTYIYIVELKLKIIAFRLYTGSTFLHFNRVHTCSLRFRSLFRGDQSFSSVRHNATLRTAVLNRLHLSTLLLKYGVRQTRRSTRREFNTYACKGGNRNHLKRSGRDRSPSAR